MSCSLDFSESVHFVLDTSRYKEMSMFTLWTSPAPPQIPRHISGSINIELVLQACSGNFDLVPIWAQGFQHHSWFPIFAYNSSILIYIHFLVHVNLRLLPASRPHNFIHSLLSNSTSGILFRIFRPLCSVDWQHQQKLAGFFFFL